jgi:type II secretory pathway component PulK/Tfp pilus assembly PilM family ATPase/Tfp pilus assembly protein PilN
MRRGEAGVALVVTVWLLAVLSVISAEFIFSSRLRIKADRSAREGVQAYALALAAYHDALDALGPDLAALERDGDDRLIIRRAARADGTPGGSAPAEAEAVRLGEGSYSWSIDAEDGKININRHGRGVLVSLLKKAGLGIGADRDIAADSILDWRDPNREHRLNGAEEDFYRTLSPPYSCKDGPFDVKEELLLVRGVKEVYYYGGTEEGEVFSPLREWITVYPVAFNPDVAPGPVLEILGRVRSTPPAPIARYYEIVAAGRVRADGPERAIKAVVFREVRGGKIAFRLLYWDDGASAADGFLRLVCLRSSLGGREIVDTAAIALPPSSGEEGTFLQEVRKFLLKNGLRSTDATVLGIPREKLLFRRITTPPLKERDLPELVSYESGRHLPGRKDDFVVGYQNLEKTKEGGYQLLLGAADGEFVDEHLNLLRGANMAPFSLQPVPVAMAALFRHTHPDAAPSLLLSLGPSSFTADSIVEGRLVSSRYFRLPAAGGHESAGAQETRRLAGEISERLSSPLFLESLPDRRMPPLWLTGAGAGDGSLVEKLESDLRVPVRTFHPSQRLRLGEGAAPASEFAAPIALALVGLDAGRGGMEMSEEISESAREAPRYGSTAALALVFLFLAGLQFGIHSLQQRRTIRQIEEETAARSGEKAAVEELSRRVMEKRSRFLFLSEKVRQRTRQADLLSELTAIVPDDTYLSDYTFREGKVEISGLAPSASRLLPLLEASPLFSGAEFSAAIVSQGKDRERFKIRLDVGGSDG